MSALREYVFTITLRRRRSRGELPPGVFALVPGGADDDDNKRIQVAVALPTTIPSERLERVYFEEHSADGRGDGGKTGRIRLAAVHDISL